MEDIRVPKKATKYQFAFEEIQMKENHEEYPLWINYNALIILETFKRTSKQAIDFLIAISEPVSRPTNIHEYQITSYSLYAAASVGLNSDNVGTEISRCGCSDGS